MKKILLLSIISWMVLIVNAQTQQGQVKTKGRMLNGQYVKGKGLEGATVTIQGQNVVRSQADGAFSFPVTSKTFMVTKVQKNGYQLVDADATSKTYERSANPIYLVMEKPEQQAQDMLESERKIRRTLQRKLDQREDELEQLKEAQKITLEEYQKALQELYENQRNNETLISKMAKEYAQLDYDQMNELNRRIHDAIINGRLTVADSLLRSKGDMRSRIEKVKREELAEKEREKEIEKESKTLEEAKSGTQKEKDDIADDCDMLCNRFMMELEVDSAIFYMELLVGLDSSDVFNLAHVGNFYMEDICMYEKAEEYFSKALDICRQTPEDYACEIIGIQNNLATIDVEFGRYPEAEKLLRDNLEKVRQYGGKVQSKTVEGMAIDEYSCLIGLSGLYMKMEQYADAETTLLKVIEMLEKGVFGYDEREKKEYKAMTLMTLGNTYYADGQSEKGDSSLMESVKIFRELSEDEPFFYGGVANCLMFSVFYLLTQEKYEQCEAMCVEALEALEKYEKRTKENQEFNKAQIWYHLALIYQSTERQAESERWFKEALNVYRRFAKAVPNKYDDLLCNVIGGLAALYNSTKRFNESELLYTEGLDKVIHLVPRNPAKFNPQLVFILIELGRLKVIGKEYHEADSLLNIALVKSKQFAVDDPEVFDYFVIEAKANLANLYSIMGVSSRNAQHFEESEQLLLKALEIQKELASINQEKHEIGLAAIMEHIAVLYWDTQRFEEAEAMYSNSLDILRKYANTDQKIQRNYGNLLYRLSGQYPTIKKYNAAYKVNKEWLTVLRQQFEEYPDLMRRDYAESLGRQSLYAIFQTQFEEAEQLALEGLKMDSTLHWISKNLAAALLLQGKYPDAQKIYSEFKDELRDSFFDDFKQFSEAGIIPKKREKDVEKIKELFNR